MNLALLGYGKMGKEIERFALERSWNISARIDIGTPPITRDQFTQTDVAIHYATAKTLLEDITPWAEAGKPIVIGTTGWNDLLPKVQELATKHSIGLVYGSNFSLGVNIFLSLVEAASKMMNTFPEYDAFIHEIHHTNKIDSPSGTALSMGSVVLEHLKRKKLLFTETSHGKINPEQLHLSSSRVGTVVGTHTLTFDSLADSIEIKHTAKNRSGFALGTLVAAEWIQKRQGVFSMTDIFKDLFASGDK